MRALLRKKMKKKRKRQVKKVLVFISASFVAVVAVCLYLFRLFISQVARHCHNSKAKLIFCLLSSRSLHVKRNERASERAERKNILYFVVKRFFRFFPRDVYVFCAQTAFAHLTKFISHGLTIADKWTGKTAHSRSSALSPHYDRHFKCLYINKYENKYSVFIHFHFLFNSIGLRTENSL